jgi:site-specific DNA recombinase
VLTALLKTYEDADLLDRVAHSTAGRSAADREQREAELAAVQAELSKTEEAVERYLMAFETGSLPEDQCGARVRALGARTAELRDRQTELQAAIDSMTAEPPTTDEIEELRHDIEKAVEEGPVTARKSFVQALVQEIRAEDRNHVVPTFRVPINGQLPAVVREPSRVVGPTGFEPVTRRLRVCRSNQAELRARKEYIGGAGRALGGRGDSNPQPPGPQPGALTT